MFSGDVSSRRSVLQMRLVPSLAVVGTRVQWSHDDLSYSRKSSENNTSNTAATRGKVALLHSRTLQRSVSSIARKGTSIANRASNDQVRRKQSSQLASVGDEKQSIHCVSRPTKPLGNHHETSTRLVLHEISNAAEPRIAWGEDSNKLKRSEKNKTTQNKAKHNEGGASVKPSPRIKSNHPPGSFSFKLTRADAFKLKTLLKSASLTEREKRLLVHQFRSMGQTLATPTVGFPEDGASDSVDQEEKGIDDSLPSTEADVEEERNPEQIMKYVDTSSNSLKEKITLLFEEQKPLNPRELVDQAIKNKKVFMIAGGHSPVRTCLRKRGWVEKFYNIPTISKKPGSAKHHKHSDDIIESLAEDCDADLHDNICNNEEYDKLKIEPWKEDGGVYGEMSQMLRNTIPSLVWVQKRDIFDYRCLTKEQMVNHYSKAGSFTTKAGLCVNLKNVMWYDDLDPDSFFPRCYLLSKDDEKNAFIDDFRLTACMNIIKVAVMQLDSNFILEDRDLDDSPESHSHINQHCTFTIVDTSITDNTAIIDTSVTDNKAPIKNIPVTDQAVMGDISATDDIGKDSSNTLLTPTTSQIQQEDHELRDEPPLEGTETKPTPFAVTHNSPKKKKKEQPLVPVYVLERALKQCEDFLAFKTHEDLDTPTDANALTEKDWDDLLHWSYLLVQEEGMFDQVPVQLHMQCDGALQRLSTLYPQLEMSGIRNVWIVKPGAKSRGRGIRCYQQLKDMLKLVSSQVAKTDGKYVVQKYIEKPLLLYNTKFDIRQWFLVTDWNPLTVWFYSDSYLRFCSQQFTLHDFNESIHLSNNAIQKNYKNGPRSHFLPAENMWSSGQFKKYLEQNHHGEVWDQKIYPLMKRIIIATLLANQELVEGRKSGFELYGADFMLTEDFSPWLLEINSSPSMEPSTTVTTQLCRAVLEDVIKVVVDRKLDKNCDTGRFELAFKQPFTATPPYIGTNLCVEGHRVKKPGSLSVKPHPIADIGVSSKGVSKMAGACKRCGNRGNLHLDTTDPDCLCQKDSCLFSLHFDRTFPEAHNQVSVKYPQSLRKMQYPSNKSPGSKKQKECYTVPAYLQDLTGNKGLVGTPQKMVDFACVRPASAHCIGTYALASPKQHKSRKSGSAHHNKLLSESDGLPPAPQQEPHSQTGSVLGNLTSLQQLRTYSSLGSLYNHTSSLVRSFSSRVLISRPNVKTDLR